MERRNLFEIGLYNNIFNENILIIKMQFSMIVIYQAIYITGIGMAIQVKAVQ